MEQVLPLLVVVLTAQDCVNDPLNDLRRFPNSGYAKVTYEFYQKRVWGMREYYTINNDYPICNSPLILNPRMKDRIVDVYKENYRAYCAWEILKQAADEDNAYWWRVSKIKDLRVFIGEEAWAAGEMPTPDYLSWR